MTARRGAVPRPHELRRPNSASVTRRPGAVGRVTLASESSAGPGAGRVAARAQGCEAVSKGGSGEIRFAKTRLAHH